MKLLVFVAAVICASSALAHPHGHGHGGPHHGGPHHGPPKSHPQEKSPVPVLPPTVLTPAPQTEVKTTNEHEEVAVEHVETQVIPAAAVTVDDEFHDIDDHVSCAVAYKDWHNEAVTTPAKNTCIASCVNHDKKYNFGRCMLDMDPTKSKCLCRHKNV